MTEPEFGPTDHVYHGIASLLGWDDALGQALHFGGAYNWRVGRIISAILLAGGEDRVPVAITGNLDDHGTGTLTLVYDDVVVHVTADKLTANTGEVAVTLHPLAAIERVEVIAGHSYYNGTGEHPRHSKIEVHVTVDGHDITFPGRSYGQNPLTDAAAANAALAVMREHLSGR